MTSCDYLRLVHIYNRYYVFLPTILHFYGNICTRPTSDQFDLISTTWSQKQKELSTTSKNLRLVADDKKTFCACDPAKSQSRRLGEWELADLKIWDTLICELPFSHILRLWLLAGSGCRKFFLSSATKSYIWVVRSSFCHLRPSRRFEVELVARRPGTIFPYTVWPRPQKNT